MWDSQGISQLQYRSITQHCTANSNSSQAAHYWHVPLASRVHCILQHYHRHQFWLGLHWIHSRISLSGQISIHARSWDARHSQLDSDRTDYLALHYLTYFKYYGGSYRLFDWNFTGLTCICCLAIITGKLLSVGINARDCLLLVVLMSGN